MTYIPYESPVPEFNDALLTFQAFNSPNVGALIELDPLGPVNKIVTLMVDDRRIKSALCPIAADTVVTVGREPGAWTIDKLFALRDRHWNPGRPAPEITVHPPGWFIEVDGRRIIDVPDHEIRQPAPKPPPIPWHRRARRRLMSSARQQTRANLDAIARRLGYHRDDECETGW